MGLENHGITKAGKDLPDPSPASSKMSDLNHSRRNHVSLRLLQTAGLGRGALCGLGAEPLSCPDAAAKLPNWTQNSQEFYEKGMCDPAQALTLTGRGHGVGSLGTVTKYQ